MANAVVYRETALEAGCTVGDHPSWRFYATYCQIHGIYKVRDDIWDFNVGKIFLQKSESR